MAGRRCPLRVERHELVGEVAHGLPDPALPPFPPRPAEAVERRRRPVARAGVFLDQVEPFDRDEELCVAGVAEVDHLADDARIVDPGEAHERAEAVVAVDDDVARPEVAEVGKKRLRRRAPLRRPGARLAEEVRRRDEKKAAGAEAEARQRPAVDDAARARRERRDGVGLEVDVVLVEKLLDVLALPLRRGGEDDREAALSARAGSP